MKTQFIKDITAIQQKRRRVPIHLQERVEEEINKLIDQKHIIKFDKSSDKCFLSPFSNNGKKPKLALNSKKINKFSHKNKYSISNYCSAT